jgi:hypothetical protein
MAINLREFKKKAEGNRKRFRSFISKLENSQHRGVIEQAQEANKEVWEQVDCLGCANCCKKMTPTLNAADKLRIATHLKMTVKDFTLKYLEYDAEDRTGECKSNLCFPGSQYQ